MGERFAALPMYDPPELHDATDALWRAIADRLAADGLEQVPRALTRSDDLAALWRRDGLLLGQTCGYPLATGLADRVQVVATPIYRAEGCEGPFHRSAILVGRSSPARSLADLRGTRAAINDWTSNTGMNLLRARIAPLSDGGRFFGSIIESGSHRRSLELVAEGLADVAAIDCVTLALLRRIDPSLTGRTRILDWTDAAPGLPLITAIDAEPALVARLRTALDAIRAPEALLIEGFARLPDEAYEAVLDVEREAARQSYPALA